MIDLRVLKPNTVYRSSSQYRLPTDPKDVLHGSVYVAVTKSMDGTANFFSRKSIVLKNVSSYIHDRLFNYRIYNLVVKYRHQDPELKSLFETKIQSKIPSLNLVFNKDALNKKNYVYDISPYNEKFFELKDSHLGMTRVNEYFRMFKQAVVDKVDRVAYPNRYLFIPLDEWGINPKDPTLYRIQRLDNWLSLFYNKLAKEPEFFKTEFTGWKFYFMTDDQCLLWEPDTADAKSAQAFTELMMKFDKEVPVSSQDVIVAKNRTAIADKVQETLDKTETPIDAKGVDKLVDKVIEKTKIDVSASDVDPVDIKEILSPKEIELEQIQSNMQVLAPKSRNRLAREIKLVQDMKNIEMGGMSLGEIMARADANKIDPVSFPVDVINPNLKEMKFPAFDEAYMKQLYKADIAKIITGFQYKDRPLYLIETEVKDVSDALNSLEEYTFKFEDEAGRRHTFNILMPKLINNRFLKVGGNKKIMVNQLIPLPVIKTGPATVQIATNYQKVFIHRFGQTVSGKVTMMFKGLAETLNKDIQLELGESTRANRPYIRTIEYDEMARKYRKITTPTLEIYLNQKNIRDELGAMKKKSVADTATHIPIAIRNKKDILFMDTDSGIVEGTGKGFMDFLADELTKVDPGFQTVYKGIKPGKKYMYSRAKIMEKKVPLVLLLAYLSGLINMMKKAGVEYRIISKEESKRTPAFDSGEEDVIEFEDAWLVYKIYPLRSSLLMNGFAEVPTKIYPIEQFLTKDVYHEIFETLFGRKNIGYAFENFQQLLIDPITEDVLRDYGLPTDFVELFLYANTLLEDNSMNDDGDLNVHRVRSNEAIVGFLYKAMASAYQQYRFTADNPNPTRLSAKKDAVIVNILTNQVTKDYSDLNPIYTAELKNSTTWKGLGGMNQDRAYNLPKRSYHPSMVGILSQASPISGAIGIARTMSVNANVASARGYLKTAQTPDEVEALTTPQIVSPAESLIPFGVTSDDPERTAMASAQSRHTLACEGSSRAPLGTGFEKVIPHLIGDTFVFKAKQDGVVLKLDEDTKVMILKYNDGTVDSINLNPDMGKNAGSGFFISNKLSPIFTAGQSFKKDQIVACNREFFDVDKRTKQPVMMTGPLARVALRYSSKVFEDSTVVSSRLANRMASNIVIKKDIALGKNSNIDYIVKKGQAISVNDPLIIFDTSHDDELTNKILAKMTDGSTDDLIAASKTPIVSKHNGVIEDIKIYYTVPKDELSESARALIESYENANAKLIRKVSKETGLKPEQLDVSLTEVEMVKPDSTGKVKGTRVNEGILIEIYTKYRDVFGVGDKLTSFVATKAVACDVFKEGEEPYLLSDSEDKIDAYIGVISVGARMVSSLPKTMSINGILVGMKKKLKGMYEEGYAEKL